MFPASLREGDLYFMEPVKSIMNGGSVFVSMLHRAFPESIMPLSFENAMTMLELLLDVSRTSSSRLPGLSGVTVSEWSSSMSAFLAFDAAYSCISLSKIFSSVLIVVSMLVVLVMPS